MNLLAHALLSGDEPGMIVGGVLADWIKGPVDKLPGGLSAASGATGRSTPSPTLIP